MTVGIYISVHSAIDAIFHLVLFAGLKCKGDNTGIQLAGLSFKLQVLVTFWSADPTKILLENIKFTSRLPILFVTDFLFRGYLPSLLTSAEDILEPTSVGDGGEGALQAGEDPEHQAGHPQGEDDVRLGGEHGAQHAAHHHRHHLQYSIAVHCVEGRL